MWQIPWHCPFPKDDVFASFLQPIRENRDKKIFVHCRLGDDRVGMMIAAYRMAEQGRTADEAMQEMESDGFSFYLPPNDMPLQSPAESRENRG
jgi:hypothetical protein